MFNAEVAKQSFSLSQSIQSHITGYHSQTTLGLAVKIHHKPGTSELMKDLSHHGYVTSYDEVLHFCKSAEASERTNGAHLHQAIVLEKTVGVTFRWTGNFDQHIYCTPPMYGATHAIAHKFQQSH